MSDEDAIRFACDTLGAVQKPAELERLLRMAPDRRRALEVGVFRGGTMWLLSQLFTFTVGIDVDPFQVDTGGHARPRPRNGTVLIGGRSSWESVYDLAFRLGPYDLVLIDGGHDYATVRDDYERYSKLVVRGGVVALHDICSTANAMVCDVAQLWQEITGREDSDGVRMVIAEPPLDWGGFGVIRFP